MPHTNNNKLMSILMSTTPRKGQTSNIEISIIHILSIDTFSTHSNFLAISFGKQSILPPDTLDSFHLAYMLQVKI
ncbi:hypothetical protein THOG11_180043 [Vibrio harveyi]|nr:hypothetical protein TH15OA1_260123 [Vibrio harveyi]CAH1557947.1 hypothetical protein THOD03_210044 [Vibrio harveyi]CAH1559594.1 hypothetical protein THOG11_180043 [Vibrio harveyi]